MKNVILLVFVLVALVSCKGPTTSPCPDTNCEDYVTQHAAQSDFLADPDCHGDLDADGDGTACEEWAQHYANSGGGSTSGNNGGSGGTTGCPTTANCGCSNKLKADCIASSCCDWIVGDGCHCK